MLERKEPETFRRKFAMFPEHDGRGRVTVKYQDGTEETLTYMEASLQEEMWGRARRGAGVYLAMTAKLD